MKAKAVVDLPVEKPFRPHFDTLGSWPSGVYRDDQGSIVLIDHMGAGRIFYSHIGDLFVCNQNAHVGPGEPDEPNHTFRKLPSGTQVTFTVTVE